MGEVGRTKVTRVIAAPREAVYRAFVEPEALAAWLPPDSMTGVVHAFEARQGGRFRMSLLYPEGVSSRGKSAENADTFQGRFETLVPSERVVWVVEFEAADPSFAGEMTVGTTLVPVAGGTEVTMVCENIPPGIRPADNEAGCRSSLEKLASFLEGRRTAG